MTDGATARPAATPAPGPTADPAGDPGNDRRAAALAGLHAAAEALWPRLEPLAPGLTIDVLPRTPSTNGLLADQARQGQTWPALVVAVEQTAGRGRLGRTWHAQPGQALTCSLRLPLPADLQPAALPGLSLAVGVEVAEALDPTPGGRLWLKWPNDLCVRRASAPAGLGKAGGILIELVASVPRCVVIGVGLNLMGEPPAALVPTADATPSASPESPPACAFPAAPEPLPWASLSQAGCPLDLADAFTRTATAVLQAWQQHARHGLSGYLDRFAARDALAGRRVRIVGGAGPGSPSDAAGADDDGTAGGIDPQGALLVHTARGLVRLASGDISVRPLA